MMGFQDIIAEGIKKNNSDCLICIVLYGKSIKYTEIEKFEDIKDQKISFDGEANTNICPLYKAIMKVDEIISIESMKTIEDENVRYVINEIEVVGIGRCVDRGSFILEDIPKKTFKSMTDKPDVKAKYYCIDEKYVVNAADFGFRSIENVFRKI